MIKTSFAKRIFSASIAVVMAFGASAMSASALDLGTLKTDIDSVLPLNGSGSTLTLNQTYELPDYISKYTGASYKVSVSDNGVLKYKDGKITAVGTGKGTVNITTKGGKKLSFSFDVPIPEKTITLDKSKLSMKTGQTSKLRAKLKNSTGRIIWKSSNTKVVSVDQNGKLKANNAGTATITATSDLGKSASCVISIGDPVYVQSIDINTHFIVLPVGQSYQLKASVTPSNADNKTLSYVVSDPKKASISGGKVTAKNPGQTKVTITSSNGKKDVCTVLVTKKQK